MQREIHLDTIAELAEFCAALVREGVTFEAKAAARGGYVVTLTGGY